MVLHAGERQHGRRVVCEQYDYECIVTISRSAIHECVCVILFSKIHVFNVAVRAFMCVCARTHRKCHTRLYDTIPLA